MKKRVIVFFHNRLAGSKKIRLKTRAQKLADQVECQLHFFEVTTAEEFDAKIDAAILKAEVTGGILAVAGGDGTLRSVVQKVFGKAIPLAVIPSGTFNYFCKDQGLPLGLDESLNICLHGTPVPIPVYKAGDLAFLLNASFGLYVAAIRARQKWRSLLGRKKWVNISASFWAIIKSRPLLDFQLNTEEQSFAIRSPLLFVSGNRHQMENIGVTLVPSLPDKLAGVYMKRTGTFGRLIMLSKTALRNLGAAKNLRWFCFRQLSVHSPQKRLTVALDGELFNIATPVEICAASQPLLLLK